MDFQISSETDAAVFGSIAWRFRAQFMSLIITRSFYDRWIAGEASAVEIDVRALRHCREPQRDRLGYSRRVGILRARGAAELAPADDQPEQHDGHRERERHAILLDVVPRESRPDSRSARRDRSDARGVLASAIQIRWDRVRPFDDGHRG